MNNIKNYQKNILGVIISVVVIFSIATFFIEIYKCYTDIWIDKNGMHKNYHCSLKYEILLL